MKRRAAGLILTVGILAACQAGGLPEPGSGSIVGEDRDVGRFTAVRVSNAIAAEVTVGAPTGIRVTADANLLDNVRTVVAGTRLEVSIEGTVQPTAPVRVSIGLPTLDGLEATSAAQVRVSAVDGESVRFAADAAARIEADGTAGAVDVEGSSAGVLDLRRLAAGSGSVALDSSAQAWLDVRDAVSGTVTSAGVLMLVGHPASVSVETDAAGQVVEL